MVILKAPSTDYAKFTLLKGNRPILKKKVDRILSDVAKGLDLFQYCPIIVCPDNKTGTLNIVDGQHRFTASVQLNKPIYYVEAPDLMLRDIARMNTNTDKWKSADFMDCYIKLGLRDYEILNEFVTKHKINIRCSVNLLMNLVPNGSGRNMETFRDGLFVCNYLKESEAIVSTSDLLFSNYVFYRDVNLLSAIQQLLKKGLMDVERMRDKIQKHPKYVDKQGNARNYIFMMEQIYNMGLQTRTHIF